MALRLRCIEAHSFGAVGSAVSAARPRFVVSQALYASARGRSTPSASPIRPLGAGGAGHASAMTQADRPFPLSSESPREMVDRRGTQIVVDKNGADFVPGQKVEDRFVLLASIVCDQEGTVGPTPLTIRLVGAFSGRRAVTTYRVGI
jgi:hypothetical protein